MVRRNRAGHSSYGCDFLQGYFFYKPVESPLFIETFAKQLTAEAHGTNAALHTLIYVCRSRQPMTQEALDELREQAASSNRAAGISGCLLYRDECFMQLLEGQRERVRALYERIRGDARISDCQLVMEAPIERRTFPDWGMSMPRMEKAITPLSTRQNGHVTFFDIAKDARFCYEFIAAYA